MSKKNDKENNNDKQNDKDKDKNTNKQNDKKTKDKNKNIEKDGEKNENKNKDKDGGKKDGDKNKDKDNKKTSIILVIDTTFNPNKCNNCDDPECENNCTKNDDDKLDEDYNDKDCNDEDCNEDDYYNDDYYNNYYTDNKKTKKRDRDGDDFDNDQSNLLDNFFKSIISNDIENKDNKKNKKKRNTEPKDEFKDYFKESSVLLPIDKTIKTLKDLIDLGSSYDSTDKNRYVINLRALNKCVKPLQDLDNMIGMKNIKEMIIDLIFFRLQNLEDKKDELWHLVIQGTPGSGKTEVAKIIGQLYYGLGITKKDKFMQVKRSDLIGKYLGHTAKMTQQIFDDARGGVLFIDEAYSLGNPEQRDSFSKECIDTINQNLTENKDTVVFIAGYKDQLNESFFSYNPGLNRRFKMRLTVDKYNASDLRDIFIKKIKENEWGILNDDLNKEIPLLFFEKNIKLFKYNGGDMENLWHLTKIVHSRRIFGKSNDLMKKINNEDLNNSLKLYCENDEVKSRNDNLSEYLMNTMYS